jgi:pimeloyl-ACP methyl ester carboxylesterase
MIVQQLAISHPDRVASLTSMMSTTGEIDVGRPTDGARQRLFAASALDRQGYIDGQLAGLAEWGSPGLVDVDDLTALYGAAFDRCFDPLGSTRQQLAVAASGSRAEALRGVRIPTLVIHGDADTLIDASGGRRTAELIDGARFELIAGLGHDYPRVFWPRFVSLIAGHALGPAN